MALQKNLFEYLEHSAAQYGDKVAFADPKNAYTFRSLLHAAEAIGTFIMTRTNALNRPIAILVERSSLSLAGFMGILASGNYYVPIDRDMPPRRLEMILRQLRPAALLGPRDAEEDMDHFAAMCPVFTLEEAQRANPVTMFLTARRQMVLDIDPAYVIYTSGSTGAPKGIVISHRAVIDFTEWMADTFRFTDEDILGNQAPFYFDLSVKDIYQGLRCGCTVHIFPQEYVLLPERLLAFADDYGITSFIWSTSSFNQLANSGALAKAAPRWLKRVIVGGEPMRARELNIWRAALPDVQYVNLYGPTEVTVDCTYYIVNKEFADDEMIPIGRPCLNKQVMLLDDDLNFVKRGQIGEICVRGIGLAKGYYNDPDKTAAAFIQNPASAYPDLIYRTGDLGIMDKRGVMRFCSRKDGQIKHMGYRIELGEIEAVLCSLSEVKNAVCLYQDDTDQIICIYDGPIDESRILFRLRHTVPNYMQPNRFIHLEQMPFNANGKIDRAMLKSRYITQTHLESTPDAHPAPQ